MKPIERRLIWSSVAIAVTGVLDVSCFARLGGGVARNQRGSPHPPLYYPLPICDVRSNFVAIGPKRMPKRSRKPERSRPLGKQLIKHLGDYDDAPRPVAAMAKAYADGTSTPLHRHRRGQLLHAVS